MANYPGSIGPRAAAAGMTVKAYMEKHKDGGTTNVSKIARLAYFAQGVHGSGKSESSEPGDHRTRRNPLYQVG